MNWIKVPILLIGAMFLQWWVSTHIWSPLLLLVLTIAVSARLGATTGMLCGFVWGLFLDVLRAHLFGGNALVFTLAAYGTGMARRQIDVVGVGPQATIVLVMSWVYFVLMGLLGLIFTRVFFWPGWKVVLLTPIYNCILVPFVYVFLERFMAEGRR